MYEKIIEELSELSVLNNFREPILIPIPLSKKRYKERGYNQSELICQELIKIDKKTNLPHIRHGVYGALEKNFSLEKNVLIKIKDTEHQVNIQDRRNRLKNLSDSFFVKNENLIKGKNIILIDDVLTTGSTLTEAKKILKNSGARKIIAFTIAH
ncbi:MAG: phosphoribosyltransferase family protein [Candidatus Paceibacterota bacterium]